MEQLKRRRYNQRYHKTLEEGVEKKKLKRIWEQEKVEAIPTPKEEISKIEHLDIEPQTELN